MNESRSVRDVDGLIDAGLVAPQAREALEAVARQFAVAISPHVLDLLSGVPSEDPIAAQFVPSAAELRVLAEELADPIGDDAHSPLEGVIHRYPDRALLMPLRICPVYCRFCFRRENVGADAGGALLPQATLENALAYIEATPSLWEVILSGGDPLLLSPRRLGEIIRRLENIPHVRVLRLHTRVPIVTPEQIDDELLEALATERALYIAVHANHAREFSPAGRAACGRLVKAGIPLLSQSVLLRGVNDDVDAMESLMRTFVEHRIKPYYLHHGDLARGTSHFRVGIAHGLSLLQQLRGRVSGLCQPTYVIDLPGGAGKVPLGPSYVEAAGPRTWRIRDRFGRFHEVRETL